MKLLAFLLAVTGVLAPTASAKGRIAVSISDRTPAATQRFVVDLRTDWVVPANDWLRLITVAPGKNWYDVVGTVTGDASRVHAKVPRDGFEVTVRRVDAKSWRAIVRLPRPGRWRLVIPNGTHQGFMVPPPAAWMPWVDVHR